MALAVTGDSPASIDTQLDFTYAQLLAMLRRAVRYRTSTHPGTRFAARMRGLPTLSDGWLHVADLTAPGCPDLAVHWHRASDRIRVARPPADFRSPPPIAYFVTDMRVDHEDLGCIVTLWTDDRRGPDLRPFRVPAHPTLARRDYHDALNVIRHHGGRLQMLATLADVPPPERTARAIDAFHGLAESVTRTSTRQIAGMR